MRNTNAAGLIPACALMAAAAGAAEPAPAAGAAAGFGWLGSLAGDCWRGEHPGGGADTQCYAWQYGRYLRGTIAIEATAKDGKPAKLTGDSVFDADTKSGRIRYSNWADVGSLVHGEAYYEGEILRFPDAKSRDEEPRTRSSWRRIDGDGFEVTRERRDEDGWKPVITVTYHRAAQPD
jgi:hypothetical protein